MTLDPVIAWSLRLGLALLFAAGAWHKLSDRKRFEAAVRAYALLPDQMPWLVSRALPVVETAVAVGLLVPTWQQWASAAAAALLSVYTIAIVVNLARGRREIDCGCFASKSTTPLSSALVARNLGLIAAACALLLPTQPRALIWIDGLTLWTTLVTVTLLWMALQRLSRTGPALRGLGGTR